MGTHGGADGAAERLPTAGVVDPGEVWALHDALDGRFRAGLLLAAFAGLRLGEVCELRVVDVDFMRGIVTPAVQFPADPLKTEFSRAAIPIPASLALTLSAHVAKFSTDGDVRCVGEADAASAAPAGVPPGARRRGRSAKGFRFQDLRRYYASLLIASGLNVKVVQGRMRHASAKTALDTYSHLWPDSDESTRVAIDDVVTARCVSSSRNPAGYRRTKGGDCTHPP